MELDSFDRIINLVNLRMGIALVPQRALAHHGRRPNIARLSNVSAFEREIIILVRRQPALPDHLTRFIENVPFGRALQSWLRTQGIPASRDPMWRRFSTFPACHHNLHSLHFKHAQHSAVIRSFVRDHFVLDQLPI